MVQRGKVIPMIPLLLLCRNVYTQLAVLHERCNVKLFLVVIAARKMTMSNVIA